MIGCLTATDLDDADLPVLHEEDMLVMVRLLVFTLHDPLIYIVLVCMCSVCAFHDLRYMYV